MGTGWENLIAIYVIMLAYTEKYTFWYTQLCQFKKVSVETCLHTDWHIEWQSPTSKNNQIFCYVLDTAWLEKNLSACKC